MDVIQQIRDHEKQVLADSAAELNRVLAIRRLAKQHGEDVAVQLACLHSLRRVFVHVLDARTFAQLFAQEDRTAHGWLRKQYDLLKSWLLHWVQTNHDQLVAPSIRTLLEVLEV